MLHELWLAQPLAFARGGDSPEPLDAYDWGPNDMTPEGTGRTTLAPADTLQIADDGTVTLKPPAGAIAFKDAEGRVRPVCPFFELHARWDGGEGPLTADILASRGLAPADLHWTVTFNNLKPYHWTRDDSDRITATLALTGDDTARHELRGVSVAANGAQYAPLVPAGQAIPLGAVQLSRPSRQFPEFRLRFTPGPGHVYAPRDLPARIQACVAALTDPGFDPLRQNPLFGPLLQSNQEWRNFSLPPERCILDPAAHWPQFSLIDVPAMLPRLLALLPCVVEIAARNAPETSSELLRYIAGPQGDMRNLPPGLFCWAVDRPDKLMSSLGMVDDFGDAVITCTLRQQGAVPLVARARVVSSPPVWAPERRPVTSIADGLADRTDRTSVRASAYVNDHARETDAEMRDLLDRAYETVGLANMDAMNDFFGIENRLHGMRPESEYDAAQAALRVWGGTPMASPLPLPLTALAGDRHRRNTVDLFFDEFLVGADGFMQRYVRVPFERQRLYDRRMPGLMRGADRRPLTLTRRQYDELAAWVASVRARAGKAP